MGTSDPQHTSEEETVVRKVTLVGVGPGDPEYVTARVVQEIGAADLVAGFATVLAVIEPLITGQRMVLTYRNQEEQLVELAQMHAAGKRCVVCCYGDLNFSAQELIARVERHCGQVERIPGISSVQVACARAALAMEETLFFTFHARSGIEEAQTEIIAAAVAGKRHLIILPLPWSFMPPQIAAMLLQAGIAGERPVIIYQRLTLPGERETRTTVQQLAAWPEEFSDLSIVVLLRSHDTSQQDTVGTELAPVHSPPIGRFHVGTGVSLADHGHLAKEKPLSAPAHHALPVGTDSVPKIPPHESVYSPPQSPPRLVITGVASGVGKTTLATGLMAALAAQGLRVQGYKVGPDYIDPTYHRAATGRASYNLDTWLSSPALVRQRFEASMRNADVAIIEGVMGLFDGRKQALGTASTAEVAKLLNAPVLLVLDVSHMGQSAAAIVHGFQHIDPDINIAGVILNKVASADHEATVRLAIAEWTGIPVLGVLRRDVSLTVPARHLGLVPIAETSVEIHKLGAALTHSVDLAAILCLAREAGPLPQEQREARSLHMGQFQERHEARSLHGSMSASGVRIGLALDNAFSFYYPETLEAFEQMGVEVVPFSPLADRELPHDLDLLYFGGGFPEVFAAQLAENRPMLDSVRSAALRGILIYAECGGYMYLGKQCIDAHHVSHDLVGILPYTFQMGTERAQLGYREVTTLCETIIGPAGTCLRGHEFHWSHIVEPVSTPSSGPRKDIDSRRLPGGKLYTPDPDKSSGNALEERVPYQIAGPVNAKAGYATETILASYIHIPLAANPEVMAELIRRSVLYRCTREGGVKCTPH